MRWYRLTHLFLMFVIGISWGYVGKTLVNHFFYIGYDDPQVVSSVPLYDVDRVIYETVIDSSFLTTPKDKVATTPITSYE